LNDGKVKKEHRTKPKASLGIKLECRASIHELLLHRNISRQQSYLKIIPNMKISIATIAAALALATEASAFAPQCNSPAVARTSAIFSTMADSGVPPSESKMASSVDGMIPTKLPSDVGFDYVPLAGALAAGDLVEADQVSFHHFHATHILVEVLFVVFFT
jgi:hypothetical protein